MSQEILLASGSASRQSMLRNAGVVFRADPVRIDEEMIRQAMTHEGAPPRDIADALAEAKAQKAARKADGALVLGSDQVLDFEGSVFAKPKNPADLRNQLNLLNGKTHKLLSAAVIWHEDRPVWRHIGVARMHMRKLSDTYLDDYVARHWQEVQHSVGGYHIESEGIRLFDRVDGDYFTVLGLPLFEVLRYLVDRRVIAS